MRPVLGFVRLGRLYKKEKAPSRTNSLYLGFQAGMNPGFTFYFQSYQVASLDRCSSVTGLQRCLCSSSYVLRFSYIVFEFLDYFVNTSKSINSIRLYHLTFNSGISFYSFIFLDSRLSPLTLHDHQSLIMEMNNRFYF